MDLKEDLGGLLDLNQPFEHQIGAIRERNHLTH